MICFWDASAQGVIAHGLACLVGSVMVFSSWPVIGFAFLSEGEPTSTRTAGLLLSPVDVPEREISFSVAFC